MWLINTTFIVAMPVAKDLPRQDQILTGLSAGQMGRASAVGIVGLKQIVDKRVESEARAVQAETALAALRDKVGGSVDEVGEVAGPGGAAKGIAGARVRFEKDRRSYDPERQEAFVKKGGKEQRLGYFKK